jgi:pyruvate/2-oxoglutarate dehydrogenase complex dihydrolipoamide acyltransferase (E2) component
VISPPQVAIVGFGAIVDRPWVGGATVVPNPTVVATLAADHRVSDGQAELAAPVDKVEANIRANLASLRTALADQADLRDVFQVMCNRCTNPSQVWQ